MPRAEGANGRPKALKTITGSSMSMDHSRSKRMICKKSIQSTLGMWMIWLSLSSKTTQTQRKTPMLGLFKAFKHSLEKRKKKKAGIMFGLCCMLLMRMCAPASLLEDPTQLRNSSLRYTAMMAPCSVAGSTPKEAAPWGRG